MHNRVCRYRDRAYEGGVACEGIVKIQAGRQQLQKRKGVESEDKRAEYQDGLLATSMCIGYATKSW